MPAQLKTGGIVSAARALELGAHKAKPRRATEDRRAAALTGALCRMAAALERGQDRSECMRS
jgi:hypothetical protein